MTQIAWDQTGEKVYETGTDHGVLYVRDSFGAYPVGVAWNGLTGVTQSPTGGEVTKTYADNIVYASLVSAEEFGATVEAYTYPDEFAACDGTATPTAGVSVGQQTRKTFGLSWRTLKGNDVEGTDFGYLIHLVYGALAAPSEKAHATVNESPEAVTFSWEMSTTPIEVTGTNPETGKAYKPSAKLTIDSTKVDATALAALEELLYGTVGNDPELPLPAVVLALFAGTITNVFPTAPTYNSATDTITIPGTAGVVYTINGEVVAAGPVIITEDTVVTASPAAGYSFTQPSVDEWYFDWS